MKKKVRDAVDLRYVDQQDWLDFLTKGGTLGDALDLSSEELDGVYALAYEKYNAGHFSAALPLFQWLCQCNHLEPSYIMGMGAARQGLKEYKLAGETYSFAALVYPSDPRFPFHAAECHLALGNWQAAGAGFEAAEALSEGRAEFTALHQRALHHLTQLTAKLEKHQQDEAPSS